MRLISIILFCILGISCSSSQLSKNEELAVIATVYQKIPKILSPPPPPSGNAVAEKNDVDYSKLKPLIFKYAINKNFVDHNVNNSRTILDHFEKDLYDERNLDSSYMKLINGVSKFKKFETIDTTKLESLIQGDVVFWDRQTITEKEKSENDISGVISFSKVSFNEDFTRAAVVVGDYFEYHGNGVELYILEKIDKMWIIKYTKILMMS